MVKYCELFYSFLKIGTFTVGGGYAMIPLMEEELVDKRQWMSREEFLDQLALLFREFRDNVYVERFFMGVRPAVVALIAAPVFRLGQSAKIGWKDCWIPIVAALLIWLFDVSPILIILAAVALGFAYGRIVNKKIG